MQKPLIVCIIGMSGSGKTYWSKKLARNGFTCLCCDDLIEEKLSPKLVKLGFKGTADVSKWMEQPYEIHYQKNAAEYLKCEIEVMQEILENSGSGPALNEDSRPVLAAFDWATSSRRLVAELGRVVSP